MADGLRKKYLLRQIMLALCSSLGYLAVGMIRGFTSPGIPSVKKTSPHLLDSPSAISLITSSPLLGAFIGGLITMPWMHYMGRKKVLLMIGPIFSLCWIGIALSDHYIALVMFRALTGFTGGVAQPACQVYVSECTDPSIRGMLSSLPAVIMTGGTLIQFILGFMMEWRGMAWVSAIFPAILTLVLIPFPESPSWLKLNKREGYKGAYDWYGITPDSEPDRDETDPTSLIETSDNARTSFSYRNIIIPLFLGLFINIFQKTGGNDVIIFNAVMIFQESGSTVDSFIASFIVGTVNLIFVFISIFLVDKFGRRVLLIFSSLAMGISVGLLSLYFYLLDVDKASNLSYLPLISLIVYIASFSLGFLTVPFILIGELYPLRYRSLLSSFTLSISLLSTFVVLITYLDLVHYFGQGGAFGFYSIMNFVAVIFIYFLLPETKEKSLHEIELLFSKNY